MQSLSILMNRAFDPLAVYEASRTTMERELSRPGSRARTDRGVLTVSKLKAARPDPPPPGRMA